MNWPIVGANSIEPGESLHVSVLSDNPFPSLWSGYVCSTSHLFLSASEAIKKNQKKKKHQIFPQFHYRPVGLRVICIFISWSGSFRSCFHARGGGLVVKFSWLPSSQHFFPAESLAVFLRDLLLIVYKIWNCYSAITIRCHLPNCNFNTVIIAL